MVNVTAQQPSLVTCMRAMLAPCCSTRGFFLTQLLQLADLRCTKAVCTHTYCAGAHGSPMSFMMVHSGGMAIEVNTLSDLR